MADPQPIKQRIETDADTSGIKEHVRAQQEMEQQAKETASATEQAGRTERTREQRLRSFRQRLNELVRAQQRYELETEKGTRATNEQRRSSERRERQIRRLAGVLGQEERAQRRANQAIREAGGDLDDAGVSAAGFLRNLRGIAASVGVFVALRQGLRLYMNELEQAKQLQSEVFQTQVTIATAERNLKENLASASDEEVGQAIEAAREIAQQRSLPIAQTTDALASALSARGGNLDEAIRLTDLAAQVRPDQPGSLGNISGAIGDIFNAIGAESELEALGFLQTVGTQSRVPSAEQQARTVPAAITGIVSEGFTPQEAGALFAALSVGTADTTGESTRTASINFAQQLNTFFKTAQRDERGASAIEALQQDPQLAQSFLDNLSLEARASAPARALVGDASSSVASGFTSNIEQFGDRGSLIATAEQQIERLNSGQLEATAAIDRDLKSLVDQLNANNLALARVGAIRDNLSEVLRASGSSALAQRIDEFIFDANNFASPEEAVKDLIDLLEDRVEDIRGQERPPFSIGTLTGRREFKGRPLTDQQEFAIEAIESAIERIQSRTEQGTPQTVIQRQTVNNGTLIQGGDNPIDDDFDGRYR
ncbi:MAG: hypothetical protein AAGI37_06925 [Planctomycetota bacterium]